MDHSHDAPEPEDKVRIAKYLAGCGVASRRNAETIISQGRVTVNNEVISDLGRRISPAHDTVSVDGTEIQPPDRHITLALNKPPKVLVTRSDDRGRTTVYDLLPRKWKKDGSRLRYAGRLDYLTTGLLILTTDGDLANRLVHPRHHVRKTYEVALERHLREEELDALRQGIELEDGPTQPCEVRPMGHRKSSGHRYELTLREGRNRQIRRMMEALGARVLELHRFSMGALTLTDLSLAAGEFRPLDPSQIDALFEGMEKTP